MKCVTSQVTINSTYHQGRHSKGSKLCTNETTVNGIEHLAEVNEAQIDVLPIVHGLNDRIQSAQMIHKTSAPTKEAMLIPSTQLRLNL